MRVIDDWKAKFPKTLNFLTNDLPTYAAQGDAVWKAFVDISGLTDAEAKQAITFGEAAPLLWFLPLGLSSGGYFNSSVPGRISLSADIAQAFEGKATDARAQQFLRLVTLHELCHWAWCRRQAPETGDAGDKFEDAAAVHPDYSWIRDTSPAPAVTAIASSASSSATPAGSTSSSATPSLAATSGGMARTASGAPVPATGLVNPTSDVIKARVKDLKDALANGSPIRPSPDVFDGIDVAQGMPRGIRNNNLGNIRIGASWAGLQTPQLMKVFQQQETSFCVFCEPEWGIRAMARLLRKYQNTYNLQTPLDIIGRWAPASDNNDVNSYARVLANALGISVAAEMNLNLDATMVTTIKAMARHENGQMPPYAELQYWAGVSLERENL